MRISYCRIPYTPLLIFIALVSILPKPAYGNLVIESEAGRKHASAFELGLTLQLGTVKGQRDWRLRDDAVRSYHAAVQAPVRYRFLYLVPELALHYMDLETKKTTGKLRSAKLHSTSGFSDRGVYKNIAAGGTIGAAIPSALLSGFELMQFGAAISGQATLFASPMTFDEMQILYRGDLVEMEKEGNRNVTVEYRSWTIAWGGFATLRVRELGWRPTLLRNISVLAPLARPLTRSALSLAAGMLHFNLDVEVEVADRFSNYVDGDQSQHIRKDELFFRLRYGVPLGHVMTSELQGSATKEDGAWLYSIALLLGARL